MAKWTCEKCKAENECRIGGDSAVYFCDKCGNKATEQQITEAFVREVEFYIEQFLKPDDYYEAEYEQVEEIVRSSKGLLIGISKPEESRAVYEEVRKEIKKIPKKALIDRRRKIEEEREAERLRIEQEEEERRQSELREELLRAEKRKKRKKVVVRTALICLIAGVCAWVMIPNLNFHNGLKKGDTQCATEIYQEKISGNPLRSMFLLWDIEFFFKGEMKAYKEEKILAEDINRAFSIVESLEDEKINSVIQDYYLSFLALSQSKESFRKGNIALMNSDYQTAILELQAVQAEDINYEIAQDRLESATESYKEDVQNQILGAMQKKKVKKARDICELAYQTLPEDEMMQKMQYCVEETGNPGVYLLAKNVYDHLSEWESAEGEWDSLYFKKVSKTTYRMIVRYEEGYDEVPLGCYSVKLDEFNRVGTGTWNLYTYDIYFDVEENKWNFLDENGVWREEVDYNAGTEFDVILRGMIEAYGEKEE